MAVECTGAVAAAGGIGSQIVGRVQARLLPCGGGGLHHGSDGDCALGMRFPSAASAQPSPSSEAGGRHHLWVN